MVAYPAVADGISPGRSEPKGPLPLQFLRASGLAQARLQLAVLSGNRRRALEQIDRLIGIDRQLERLARGEHTVAPAALASELADQRLAIASEKLALTSEISLPRLEPAFGAGMIGQFAPDEDIEVIEPEVLASGFAKVLVWTSGLLVLTIGVAAAVVFQL